MSMLPANHFQVPPRDFYLEHSQPCLRLCPFGCFKCEYIKKRVASKANRSHRPQNERWLVFAYVRTLQAIDVPRLKASLLCSFHNRVPRCLMPTTYHLLERSPVHGSGASGVVVSRFVNCQVERSNVRIYSVSLMYSS